MKTNKIEVSSNTEEKQSIEVWNLNEIDVDQLLLYKSKTKKYIYSNYCCKI